MDISAFMSEILAQSQTEFDQYMVASGSVVRMNDGSTHLVTNIIFDAVMRKQSPEGKVWGLFCMVDRDCGMNWETPIPRMSEGLADIRTLLGGPGKRITAVTFLSSKKTARGKTVRTYQVTDSMREITRATVTSR